MIDFRNINTLWSSILVETLSKLGLTTVVICPGSRSTPLTFAFAQHSHIEAIPILDERSAAFFALGLAKKLRLPVALVCTSGTAAANFYPAVIEAKYSHIPLLILTADRPPELRECHAGQTIDQLKLYGNYPNWQIEIGTPLEDIQQLCYLRQILIAAWERTLLPTPGIVHLNIPFREPLSPIENASLASIKSQFDTETFFQHLEQFNHQIPTLSSPLPPTLLDTWQNCPQGIIIAGLANINNPWQYCRDIARLSEFLGWPVLAEALSPLRNYAGLNPYLISTYDLILRNPEFAQELTPKMVIQLGELPTSKELRIWLQQTQPQRWIIEPIPENFDPLFAQSIHLRTSIEQLVANIPSRQGGNQTFATSNYLQFWCDLETKVRKILDQTLQSMDTFFEGKVAWILSQNLPAATPIFIANSMSVRYAEFFWSPRNSGIIPFFSRGTNGIDGTLSTALGVAHRHQSSILLTGDLALLHDTNGFLLANKFVGHLTIILINNNGGGIFEMLPVSQFEPPFEEFFATPQYVDFSQLCKTYGIVHHRVTDWEKFSQLLNPLPETGIRLLEIRTNRKIDMFWLQNQMKKLVIEL